MSATGRYAPSPTGELHLGNLRTALLAWLFARSQGAPFLLRVEDLDPVRSRLEHERGQLADLRAIGVDWDGEPVRQSERGERYEAAVVGLRESGLVYECFCTRAEIREAVSAPHGEQPEGAYPGTCRELSETERAARRSTGRPAAIRVRSDGARIEFEDRLYGPRSALIDDFVLRRNDGAYGYNLAVVVDDAAQGVEEVVRGRDLLDSTPRQIWLARALGLPEIASWAHVPLLVSADGRRLAKRDGAVTLDERRARGETPAETRALLAASVGLCDPGDRPEIDELVARFDPDRLPREDASPGIATK